MCLKDSDGPEALANEGDRQKTRATEFQDGDRKHKTSEKRIFIALLLWDFSMERPVSARFMPEDNLRWDYRRTDLWHTWYTGWRLLANLHASILPLDWVPYTQQYTVVLTETQSICIVIRICSWIACNLWTSRPVAQECLMVRTLDWRARALVQAPRRLLKTSTQNREDVDCVENIRYHW